MQHFQPILIIIGILAIAAVLIHGYLLNRKAKSPVIDGFSNSDTDQISTEKTALNDQDGIIGDVRIIQEQHDNDDSDFFTALDLDETDDINFSSERETLAFSENIDPQDHEDDLLQPMIVTDLDPLSDELEADVPAQTELKNSKAEPQYPAEETQDIFIFNVVAREEAEVVRGHELLQFFLTAGFRFGEMSIFHRHLNSNGTGPILFSIANMMAPGVFDPENMEQFRSQGVSFFLTVPNNNINVKEAFDMMLVAVEQMAEEFDCLVLNGEREPLTEQQFRNYHERLLRYI
ncbi:MAG: cell division protein ZipA [Psychromonas sp.]|jgi:cell division protein ZipA|uniref:cell division protein ZipA n=1 Tax=Psychromonas sp. TaxID=1884585 RepID=UPI0039E3B818